MSEPGWERWMARVEKKLDDALRAQAEYDRLHDKESGVKHTKHESRLGALEQTQAEMSADKKGIKSAFLGAGLGGAVALAGSWLAKKLGFGVVLFAVVISGCGVTDATKNVVVLDGMAAEAITKDVVALRPHVADADGIATLGLIDRRAHAIMAGSAVIEKVVGSPSERPVYSLDSHEKWIVVAVTEEERNANIIDAAVGAVETAAKWAGLGVAGLGILGTAIGWIRKAKQLSASQELVALKDKTIGVFVRGVQKSDRDGTQASKEIAAEADHSDLKAEVHAEVLAKKDASVITAAPVVVDTAPADPVPDPSPVTTAPPAKA